ncbi:MAG TPA: divergent polysaccharide deacetylase family protein, partial [Candidatus Hydrogenedentes bacterium]|nr:divergent polysaccharide deacetylase family protein [Candidatus Hydrogenedentota bacterium]
VEGPRVAIIVDDGGYGGPVTETILALDAALTLSILPDAPEAEETARRAAERGFEIMLHMPMEACNVPGQLRIAMTSEEVAERIAEALEHVPGAAGVNNHAGSTFTADIEAMARFMAAIKPHHLYFIDSRTTVDTCAYDAAKRQGVRAASRSVFLDNKSSADYIGKQFAQLVALAQEQGEAIGIGHFRSATAKVLPQLLATLKEQGVSLVHASELAR